MCTARLWHNLIKDIFLFVMWWKWENSFHTIWHEHNVHSIMHVRTQCIICIINTALSILASDIALKAMSLWVYSLLEIILLHNDYFFFLFFFFQFLHFSGLWLTFFPLKDLSCKNTISLSSHWNETLRDTPKYMREANTRRRRGLGTAASSVCRDCTFHGSFRR